MDQEALSEIIKRRRTKKPAFFHSAVPGSTIIKLIDLARHAPNHHRTEPTRFYLLNRDKILKLARLFGNFIRGNGSDSILVERGLKKEKEWSLAPGLLVVTSLSDSSSVLIKKNPNLIEENYATSCCIVQNLLLLFETSNISAKWSTAPVCNHPEFNSVIGVGNPKDEKFVGFIFYGYSDQVLNCRQLSPVEEHLIDYSA